MYMNVRMVWYIVGRAMWIGAILLLFPLLVTFIYREDTVLAFAVPIIVLLTAGILLGYKRPKNDALYAKEGFFVVALSWIVLSVAGAVPFYLSIENISFVDCLFETVSGFTTTGASILSDVENLPHSLLFWRSFTHWIGGMGVLVFMLAILPQSDFHSVHLMRAEVPGPQVGKLVSKLKFNVRILYGIYIVITLIEILLLLIGGMPAFDSVVTSFATAGTGGFAIKNISIAFYDSLYIDIVIGVFMILFGINFNIFYLIIAGSLIQALKSEELRYYLSIIAISVILIAINITQFYSGFAESLRYSFFQVSSIITTTGFATADFNLWPTFSKIILLLLMFFGACAGSTGGGMKISRVIIIFKNGFMEIKRMVSPRSVNSLKLEGRAIDTNVIREVNTFFSVYMIITACSIFIIAIDDVSMVTAITAVVACINNIGPGLELVGPMGNYSTLSALSKVVLMFDMLAGRLELFPILMLFSTSTWKRR